MSGVASAEIFQAVSVTIQNQINGGTTLTERTNCFRHFIEHPAEVVAITNIEVDHLDNWGTAENYFQGFVALARQPEVRSVVLSADDPGTRRLRPLIEGDGRRVEPGSEEMGMVSVGGYIPLGYYKDEAKTASTFRTFEGRRWSVPGDFATVDADGSLHLLGRGSVCINTGGEKVFPEEVEEALKLHPSVRDAVVVGIPDERFGETICGVVEAADGATIDSAELRAHVAEHLAAYKAPRTVVEVDTIGRAAMRATIAGFSTPGPDRPRNRSAPSITSSRLRWSVVCA